MSSAQGLNDKAVSKKTDAKKSDKAVSKKSDAVSKKSDDGDKSDDKCKTYDSLKVNKLKVKEISGFSPVEFSDLVICQSGLESQAQTLIYQPDLDLTSTIIQGSAGSSAGYITIKLDGVVYKLQIFNDS